MKRFWGIAAALLLNALMLRAEEQTLKLGFMPYLSADVLMQRYTPLANYLTQKLGVKVEIFISSDYAEHINKTGKDEICISFLGGVPYVEVVERYGKKPILARFEFDHKATFQSAILVAENAPFKTLFDLKGRSFAFGNRDSTLSTLAPLNALIKAGVKPSDLSRFSFLNNHENVYYSVLYGDFDAGGVGEEILADKPATGVRILAKTEPLSTHVFVARSNLDPKMQQAIRKALYELGTNPLYEPILQVISANLTGFVPAQDSDYDAHRKLLTTIQPILEQL